MAYSCLALTLITISLISTVGGLNVHKLGLVIFVFLGTKAGGLMLLPMERKWRKTL